MKLIYLLTNKWQTIKYLSPIQPTAKSIINLTCKLGQLILWKIKVTQKKQAKLKRIDRGKALSQIIGQLSPITNIYVLLL